VIDRDRRNDALGSTGWLTTLRAYLVITAVGHLIWETLHLPLYTIWSTGTAAEKAFAVVHCSGGDILIALSAISIALLALGDNSWPERRFAPVAWVTIGVGIGYTIFSEWLNIVVRKSWQYTELMPTFDVVGFEVGLSPLLQWVVVPSCALVIARHIGRTRIKTRDGNVCGLEK
jgi:hypothetical protein